MLCSCVHRLFFEVHVDRAPEGVPALVESPNVNSVEALKFLMFVGGVPLDHKLDLPEGGVPNVPWDV